MDLEHINYDVDGPVALITLNRPEKANAQHYPLLHELHSCWMAAANDPDVRVILLQANGTHFSAGHDISFDGSDPEVISPITASGSWDLSQLYQNEARVYLGYCFAWRNVPKPSIAAVQGKCIAGGLMLCWPCDLIVAAENAEFSDPVIRLGLGSIEYLGHPWEMGPRKAKELLFTGRSLDAHAAERLGMVNRVVPVKALRQEALSLAHEIAANDPFALLQAKRAINQTLDVQGFSTAVQAAFDIHGVGHGAAISRTGAPTLADLSTMKTRLRATPEGRGADR